MSSCLGHYVNGVREAQVIGWTHEVHAKVVATIRDYGITYVGKADSCMNPTDMKLMMHAIGTVLGTWTVDLQAGQHVHVPAMHVFGWFNVSGCIALHTSSAEGAAHNRAHTMDQHGLGEGVHTR